MADYIFRSNKDKVEKVVKSALDIGMEAVAAQAEANAKKEATLQIYDKPPSDGYVRTGAYRNSLAHRYVPADKTAYIGSNIHYAKYIEFGTRYVHARPVLQNAINRYNAQYRKILESALRDIK